MFLKGFWNFLFIYVFSPSINAQSFAPPEILNCPGNILHAIAYDETSATVTWQEPSSNPVVTPVMSHIPGSRFNLGKTSVRYTFTSHLGERANCDFSVEVKRIDTIAPEVVQCPRGVSASISPIESSVSVSWTEPSATDNTGTDVLITKTHSPGEKFGRGFTVVNYTIADTSGNVNLCSFSVTVYLVDNVPPTVENCPSDITMTAESHNAFEAVSWMEPSATDETSQSVNLEVYKSHSPGDRFRAGVTNVLYVFADESQNVVTCTFQVHLDPQDVPRVSFCPRSRIEVVENDDPVPTNQEPQAPQFITQGTSFLQEASSSSNWNRTFVQTQLSQLSSNREIICSYDVYILGDLCPCYRPTVLYLWCVDSANSTSTLSPCFSDHTCWLYLKVDTIAPDIVNCQDRTEVKTASLGLKGWSGSVPVAGGDFTASYSPGAPESYFFPLGETVLAILLEDSAKNTRVCSILVVVNPAITGCPQRISGESKTNENSLVVYWPSPASVPSASFNTNKSSGTVFMIGSTPVQYEFVDTGGMRGICEFKVTVTEENPLILTSCPDDIVKILPSDSDSVDVTWALPDADNKLGSDYNVIGISATHNSGDTFSVGETTVVYKFQDEDKPRFEINCTFVVSVKDTTDPGFVGCPSDVRLSVLAWFGTFDWEENITPMDNSGNHKVFASHNSSFQYPLGETHVNLTVVDSSGNSDICTFPVIVSLILPFPVLILIGVVILLLVVFTISCCCCCRVRCCNRDEDATVSHDTHNPSGNPSNKEYYNQQALGDNNSKAVSGPPRKEGNKYTSEMEMNYIQPHKPNSLTNNEYVYVDETPPPVPTTPRPGGSNVAYVNDSVDKLRSTFPRDSPNNNAMKKTSTVEAPKISEDQEYLKPADVPHEYVYADEVSNPKEYSYAYDHRH